MNSDQLAFWPGWSLYKIEAQGERLNDEDKIVVRGPVRLVRRIEAWTPESLLLWLADIVERVLPIYEAYPRSDPRLRRAVETIRASARGEATFEELQTAQEDARLTTVRTDAYSTIAAVRAATKAAVRAATVRTTGYIIRDSEDAAAYYVVTAASTAAREAVHAAVHAAAADDDETRAVERRWQNTRMWQYIRGERK